VNPALENKLRNAYIKLSRLRGQIRNTTPERTPDCIVKGQLGVASRLSVVGGSVTNAIARVSTLHFSSLAGGQLSRCTTPVRDATRADNLFASERKSTYLIHVLRCCYIWNRTESPPKYALHIARIVDRVRDSLDLGEITIPILPVLRLTFLFGQINWCKVERGCVVQRVRQVSRAAKRQASKSSGYSRRLIESVIKIDLSARV
jgi:hypothetical protein